MGERARIARYFAPLAAAEPGSFSLTDDAAVLTPPAGHSLVITTDSVIQSLHVLADASAQQFAQKLVRRNLSDLAAMGAMPWRYSLNLHTPHGLTDAWFAEFSAALAKEQQDFGMVLIGGDSTSAADATIHATMTCFGLVDGAALTRSGAGVGEDIYVSGTIGDASLGLHMLQGRLPPNDTLIARYHLPQPRLALGAALRGIATSCIDLSDGLLGDAAQLGGAVIERARIPLSPAAQPVVQAHPKLWDVIVSGGDDYELCFTANMAAREKIATLAAQLALPLTRIGTVAEGKHLTLLDEDGNALPLPATGFEHA